jgi:hypothetical protein
MTGVYSPIQQRVRCGHGTPARMSSGRNPHARQDHDVDIAITCDSNGFPRPQGPLSEVVAQRWWYMYLRESSPTSRASGSTSQKQELQ